VVIALEQNSALIAHFDMGIHASMPPLTEWHFEGLRLLAPHLRRAAIISGLLEGRTRAAESFEAVLGALRSAVVMVDANMRIVYANQLAEEMFDAGGPLVRKSGQLDLPRELVRGQLRGAVDAAAADAGGLRRGSGIPVRLSGGERMVAHVLPLARRRLAGTVSRPAAGPVAAVFVAQANTELNLPVEAIQLLYELTPMETRVLELTVAGRASREIAEALGVAPSTIKTHTLNLYEKTGRHRREDLVRLANEVSLS
jgi:DNA-binding CsgD family transcriptional regulator